MFGILVDTTKCTACERCVAACVQANGLDPHQAETDRYNSPDGLSANRWLNIAQVDQGRFARQSCMHCVEPSCVAACLVGGLTKTADGPVVYDADKCIGCRYCMLACPFHVPRYEWDQTAPFVRKCTMCFERLEQGEQPACVGACPNGALVFGERETLLKKAKAMIQAAPTTYQQHVWGEDEFGGTSVLYVSDTSLTSLGWPENAAEPIPALTDPLIHKTPFIGMGVGLGLIGLNWIVRRRMKLADPSEPDEGPDHE